MRRGEQFLNRPGFGARPSAWAGAKGFEYQKAVRGAAGEGEKYLYNSDWLYHILNVSLSSHLAPAAPSNSVHLIVQHWPSPAEFLDEGKEIPTM